MTIKIASRSPSGRLSACSSDVSWRMLNSSICSLSSPRIDAWVDDVRSSLDGGATFIQLREKNLGHAEFLNEAKEILAYELTSLVHGTTEAEKARGAARDIFAGGGSSEHMPSATLKGSDFRDDTIDLIGILAASGMAQTRSEARRAIEQGGVVVNNEKVNDVKKTYSKDEIASQEFIVRKGKKMFKKINVE